ncbi:DUF2510 domain-containing protein [Leucobacter iarius]|uniref:Transglutaminase-like domain-containing protein n=1 Tax=Leucobacter iarius TaxID=333963 RepID=A0ABN2LQS8_9MICO
MTEQPAPGWYPDPIDSGLQRWWDGGNWTDHVHPAGTARLTAGADDSVRAAVPTQAAPGLPGRRPRKKLRTLAIVAGAVAIVLALSGGALFVMIRTVLGSQIELSTDAEAVPGREFAMTDPIENVASNTAFSFPADYDFASRQKEDGDFAWAFELFLDPTLTVPTGVWVSQSKTSGGLEIRPSDSTFALMAEGGGSVDLMSQGTNSNDWGLHPEYYLVRHIDEHGEKLKKPVVTKISTRAPGIEAPGVRATVDRKTGSIELSWTPVEGATEYIVVGSSALQSGEDSSPGRHYEALAKTSGTSWSSKDDTDSIFEERQNAHLAIFDGLSADEILKTGRTEPLGTLTQSGYQWGVIASNGRDRSRIATADLGGMLEALPYETAKTAMGGQYLIVDRSSLNELPKRFSFTSLDGRTRETRAFIPEGGIARNPDDPDQLEFTIVGVGTKLEWKTSWLDPDPGFDAEAFRTAYNAKAAAAAPPTGGEAVLVRSIEQAKSDAKPVSNAPKTEYPVYGSNDYVKYIAGHMILGDTFIDVTRYADAPGAQTVTDAVQEARAQNPYVIDVVGFDDMSERVDDRTLLRVDYGMQADERKRIQASIKRGVDQTLSSVVTAGMSDRDKAVALNDWLAAHTVYDGAARDALEAGKGLEGFEYAWRADGVFEKGRVVCGGYAVTYNALMNAAGVPTVYVAGDVLSAGPHAWNKVKIDGAWYAVDTTWNDSASGANRYLLIPDSGFTGTATRVEDSSWVRDDLLPSFAAK